MKIIMVNKNEMKKIDILQKLRAFVYNKEKYNRQIN